MTSDYKQLYPNRVMILPYLHERKIFLTQMDHNFEYFYTSISIPNPNFRAQAITFFVTMNISESKILVFNSSGILKRTIDYVRLAEECGKPEAVSENGQILLFL